MRLVINISFLVWLITLNSCNKCGNRVGSISEQTIQPGQYSSINIEGAFHIKVIQDSSYSLTIKGGEGLIENIDYEIVGDTLRVVNTNKCDFLRNYKGEVELIFGMAEIQKIQMLNPDRFNSVGTLKSPYLQLITQNCGIDVNMDIDVKSLEVLIDDGTPTVNLKGEADHVYYTDNSYGHLKAFDLITEQYIIYSRATGIYELNVSDTLHVDHQGSGMVYYKGNPFLDIKIGEFASAEVKKAD